MTHTHTHTQKNFYIKMSPGPPPPVKLCTATYSPRADRTHNLGYVEPVARDGRLPSVSTEELECGQQPEDCAYAVQDCRVLKTQGDVHFIVVGRIRWVCIMTL